MEVGLEIIGRLDVRREQDQRIYGVGGLSPCLRALNSEVKIMEELKVREIGNLNPTFESQGRVYDKMETPRYRIRKLTPRECWRLMGYTDEDFDRAAKVNSNTQLYKEAGNAIVKQVLMAIFRQLKPKMREQK